MTDRKDAIMYVIGKLFHYDPVLRVYWFGAGDGAGGYPSTGVSRDLMDDLVKQAEERQAMTPPAPCLRCGGMEEHRGWCPELTHEAGWGT